MLLLLQKSSLSSYGSSCYRKTVHSLIVPLITEKQFILLWFLLLQKNSSFSYSSSYYRKAVHALMIPLSGIVITRNEAHNIARCLDSLQLVCEEVIVIDDYSTDDTPSICQRKGVKFVQRAFDTFYQQKSAAVLLTQHDYILALDADECLSKALIHSIQALKVTGFPAHGYQMRRLSFYKDRPVRSCGWYPNWQLRLWRKGYATFAEKFIHEHLILRSGSSLGQLEGDILHYAYQNPSQMQQKALHYSSLYAEAHRFRRRCTSLRAVLKSCFTFFKVYILKRGWIEGYLGLLIARAHADGVFYKYIKLLEANRNLRSSLIITTYNSPHMLKEALQSIRRQSLLPLEVIVADDGSGEETRQLIQREQLDFPIPLRHCWQEDRGFRLSRIRNKALSMAEGEYIVLIDGDIVLHHHFIRDQQRYCQKGYLIQGSRIYIHRSGTQEVLERGWSRISLWSKLLIYSLKGPYLPLLSSLFSREKRDIWQLCGCLNSFWKADAYAINGYNEAYQAWGQEDNDFYARMQHYGLGIRKLKLVSLGYHLYHERRAPSLEAQQRNMPILQNTLEKKLIKCEEGLNLHLN